MKITKVEVFRLQADPAFAHNRPIGCRIFTDAGIVGHGEAGIAYRVGGSGAFGALCDLSRMIIGKDPMDIEMIWETFRKTTFWAMSPGALMYAAMSAIDIALWDIKGKYFNVPVYMLLGGKFRTKLRAYASQLQGGWGNIYEGKENIWCKTPEDYATNARIAVDEGYDALKYDFFDRDADGKPLPFFATTGIIPNAEIDRIERNIKAVRDEVGYGVDIIMENHSRTDALGALQLAQLAEKYRMMAFEEPNPPTIATLEYIAQHTNVPLANGERIFSRWGYADYFKRNLIQLAQPDVANTGGITETKKICDMAHAFDVGIQVHVAGSPLVTNVALQIEACIPNFIIHEHHVCNRMSNAIGLTIYNDQPVNGYFDIDDRVGIGNEWDPEAIANKAVLYQVIE